MTSHSDSFLAVPSSAPHTSSSLRSVLHLATVTNSRPFVQTFFFCHTSESCLALLSQLLTVFRCLICLDRAFLASVLVFSLPMFLFCASTWRCATGAAWAQRTRFQPALKSQPAHGWLSVPGAAPITLPHQHIYCTCLLAPCHPYTAPLHLLTEPGRRDFKKDNIGLRSIENNYSGLGQACLTFPENTHGHPERYSTSYSACWLPCTICQQRNNTFLWRPPTLWWSIKAYLLSLRLLTETLFEVISLYRCILYSVVMTRITLKKKRHWHKSSVEKLIISLITVTFILWFSSNSNTLVVFKANVCVHGLQCVWSHNYLNGEKINQIAEMFLPL